MNYNKQNNV